MELVQKLLGGVADVVQQSVQKSNTYCCTVQPVRGTRTTNGISRSAYRDMISDGISDSIYGWNPGERIVQNPT